MAQRVQITFDCRNVHMMSAWWADRLGYVVDDAHEAVQGLLDAGVLTPDDIMTVGGRLVFADGAAAQDPEGIGPRLYFQAVPEPKDGKNRLHLDVPRGDAELTDVVNSYVAAGATLTEYGSHPGHTWAVMADPEGNEFCIQ